MNCDPWVATDRDYYRTLYMALRFKAAIIEVANKFGITEWTPYDYSEDEERLGAELQMNFALSMVECLHSQIGPYRPRKDRPPVRKLFPYHTDIIEWEQLKEILGDKYE